MWEESYYIISSFAEIMDLILDESLKSDSTEWLYGHYRMFRDYAEDLIIPDCHLYCVSVPVRASDGSFSSYRDSMTQMYVIRTVISLLESVISGAYAEGVPPERKDRIEREIIRSAFTLFAETNGTMWF